MVTVINDKNQKITFSKNSILKIISVKELHTICFTDGSTENFVMNDTDFLVLVCNKLV